ncbi:uncharacterized protein LOC106009086 isoform X3 [Heterocephalus glaber]|uniref:Uncharacterized protein LOC106009086 isoform X3 n=1 Tax=Heterocephalus glaber TaxID=10181 RepID=A0AAX6SQZ7_HETGA|nr:uncharacterized protein LOC106009086 isoform X3 [Heterocephalus glaber]
MEVQRVQGPPRAGVSLEGTVVTPCGGPGERLAGRKPTWATQTGPGWWSLSPVGSCASSLTPQCSWTHTADAPTFMRIPVYASRWLPWRCPWDRVEGIEREGSIPSETCACLQKLLSVRLAGDSREVLRHGWGKGSPGSAPLPGPRSLSPSASPSLSHQPLGLTALHLSHRLGDSLMSTAELAGDDGVKKPGFGSGGGLVRSLEVQPHRAPSCAPAASWDAGTAGLSTEAKRWGQQGAPRVCSPRTLQRSSSVAVHYPPRGALRGRRGGGTRLDPERQGHLGLPSPGRRQGLGCHWMLRVGQRGGGRPSGSGSFTPSLWTCKHSR